MKYYLLILTSCLIMKINAQKLFDFALNDNCSYYGEKIEDHVYGFESSNEANSVITEILMNVGLEKNFEIRAANVPNAAAVINGSTRYILYSENFMQSVNSKTGSKWSAISIIAHEIGHHLNGHTLDKLGSRPPIELEADIFSGFALALMGATLEEAQLAMNNLGSDGGSATHPPKSARLEAIASGFRRAKETRVESKSNTTPSSTTTPSQPSSNSSCTVDQTDVTSLINRNWSSIRTIANFDISTKQSFKINNFNVKEKKLHVSVFSEGFLYDINFSVELDIDYSQNCIVIGHPVKVFKQ